MHTGDYEYTSFDAMGTRVSFWIDRAAGHRADAAFRVGATFIRDFDRRLSRFNPESELCALNAAPEETVAVSTLMARLVAASIESARVSGGLVDPTLVDQIEHAGYTESLAGVAAAPLEDALKCAPAPAPAAPDSESRWREISVDSAARTVTRPPGLRIDSGGCGKGLAADLVANLWGNLLEPGTAFIVDCGGDMRLGQLDPDDEPYAIRVDTRPALTEPLDLHPRGGGVATSGLGNRVWRSEEGFSHHLLDPSTGRPAWTGLASATALAPSALLAETAAKTALLSGPGAAEIVLGVFGGLTVDYDGRAAVVESARTEAFA